MKPPLFNRMICVSRKSDLLLLAGLCFLCFFWRLGAVGLFDFNEGLYAQAAREMYLRGDYIAARVNGVLFFDKPPLALWCTALSFHLFGTGEFAARLPVALAATTLTYLTYLFGTRFFGRRAGLLAAALLALNPIFLGTARQLTMDLHQSLWVAVALCCYFLGYKSTTPPGKRWYYGFWIGCGLAFMAKSVPGLIPLVAAFVFVCAEEGGRLQPIFRRVLEAKPAAGLLLLLLIIAPWHLLAYREYGSVFYREYWMLHHVQLLKGTDFSHVQPVWYYIPALFGGFFPWSLFLPPALLWSIRRIRMDDASISAHRFILIWAAVVFLLFSAMTSKLISYLLPMYAAVSLLVGAWMSDAIEQRRERGLGLGMAGIALILTTALIGGSIFLRHIHATAQAQRLQQDVPAPLLEWAWQSLLLLSVGSILSTASAWLGGRMAAVKILTGTMVLFVGWAAWKGLDAAEVTLHAPLHVLTREAGNCIRAGIPLAIHIGQPRHPSVFFYLPASIFRNRPYPPPGESYLVERGEQEPILAFLARNPTACVLTDVKRAEALQTCLPALQTERRIGKWVLLSQGRHDGIHGASASQRGRRRHVTPAEPAIP